MSEDQQSSIGSAAWADLASVRRTVEWVGLDEARLESTVYTGAGLVRLLGRMAARPELTSEVSEAIAQLLTLWSGFDEADLIERTRIVGESRTVLEAFVSMGELGARPLDLSRRARLSKPSRRDRRPRAEPKAENQAEAAPDGEAAGEESVTKAPEPGESAAANAASPAEAPEAVQETSDDPAAESTEDSSTETAEEEAPRPFAWLNLPERSPVIKSRPPRSIDWNDPAGAAMPLAELDILSDEQSAALDAAGMGTVGSFLSRPPVAHTRVRPAQFGQPSEDDEAEVSDADLGTDEDPVMVRGRLTSRRVRLSPHMARYEVHIEARQAGSMRLAWVGSRPRGWQHWRAGMELAFVGTPTEDDDGWTLFEAEPVGIDGRGSGLVPTYGNADVDEATMRNVAGSALLHIRGRIRESLPQKLIDNHKLMSLDEALRDAHFPSNKAGRGRSRLAFEELLLLQAGIGWRARTRNRERGISHKVIHNLIGELSAQRQVRLSDSAERVFSEIRRDLNSGHAMVRLLQGEVGTDKHTIAMMASAIVVENKAQVLFVLPDAESAERRFLFSDGLFRSVGHAPALVTGTPSRGQLDAISRGECQVVFGTHEMLRSETKWKKLGLVIVEERNEYGTVDPARLVENGPNPDLLVITDTPIPSSLTLTVFGEYQMSTVENDYPVRCSTSIFTQEQRLDAYAEVRVAVEEGRQAFVVFPVGDSGDLLTPEQALHYASGLQAEALDGVRIGVYCSAMSREDRLRVFDDFRHRRLDVLVATTHIEEAPTLMNAVVVVVEHADHHELARLHRLRGHVGQGAESGQCLLVMSENPSKDAQSRLAQLVAEKDGYKIAEMDLKDRGWAALLGDAAEDAPVFHWADPVLDHQQLLSARDEAFRIVKADPGMRRHRNMVAAVGSRWGEWLGTDFAAIQSDSRKQSADGTNKRSGRRRRRRRR